MHVTVSNCFLTDKLPKHLCWLPLFASLEDIIDKTARSAGKRALCMGGAKNHLIAMPDCDEESGAHANLGLVKVGRYFVQDYSSP